MAFSSALLRRTVGKTPRCRTLFQEVVVRIPIRWLDRFGWLLAGTVSACVCIHAAGLAWRELRAPSERAARVRPLIQTAAEQEMSGATATAERTLLRAASLDRRFEPAWALANFYFRQDRPAELEHWLRHALEMSYGDRRAVFDLCWRAGIKLPVPAAAMRLDYVRYLLESDRLDAAIPFFDKPDPPGAPFAMTVSERLIGAGRFADAHAIWKRFEAARLLHKSGASGQGFDWRIGEHEGVAILASGSRERPSFDLVFHGRTDEAELLSQWVRLDLRRFAFEIRTRDARDLTGIGWALESRPDRANLFPDAVSLKPSSDWRTVSLEAPPGAAGRYARLSLALRRPPGTPRLSGAIELRNLRWEPAT